MIEPFPNLSDRMEFRCSVCDTVFNHAVRVFNGGSPRPNIMIGNPNRWGVICIELRCPGCATKKTFKLCMGR